MGHSWGSGASYVLIRLFSHGFVQVFFVCVHFSHVRNKNCCWSVINCYCFSATFSTRLCYLSSLLCAPSRPMMSYEVDADLANLTSRSSVKILPDNNREERNGFRNGNVKYDTLSSEILTSDRVNCTGICVDSTDVIDETALHQQENGFDDRYRDEPLLCPNSRRYVIFPIQYHDIWLVGWNCSSARDVEIVLRSCPVFVIGVSAWLIDWALWLLFWWIVCLIDSLSEWLIDSLHVLCRIISPGFCSADVQESAGISLDRGRSGPSEGYEQLEQPHAWRAVFHLHDIGIFCCQRRDCQREPGIFLSSVFRINS